MTHRVTCIIILMIMLSSQSDVYNAEPLIKKASLLSKFGNMSKLAGEVKSSADGSCVQPAGIIHQAGFPLFAGFTNQLMYCALFLGSHKNTTSPLCVARLMIQRDVPSYVPFGTLFDLKKLQRDFGTGPITDCECVIGSEGLGQPDWKLVSLVVDAVLPSIKKSILDEPFAKMLSTINKSHQFNALHLKTDQWDIEHYGGFVHHVPIALFKQNLIDCYVTVITLNFSPDVPIFLLSTDVDPVFIKRLHDLNYQIFFPLVKSIPNFPEGRELSALSSLILFESLRFKLMISAGGSTFGFLLLVRHPEIFSFTIDLDTIPHRPECPDIQSYRKKSKSPNILEASYQF